MKRVLLTGATGLVGQFCVPALLERGYEVHALTSKSPPPRREDPSGIHWHRADLLAEPPTELLATLRPTHLLHGAWYMEPERLYTSLENFRWVRASLGLLEAFAAAGGTRAVMLGSCAEYDWSDGLCVEGRTPTVPTSTYGVCKLALGQLALAFARQAGLSCAWARVFFLYGPHENPNRLVASVVRALLRGEPAYCSTGEQRRDLLHARDVADACAAILDGPVEGVVNVASGEAVAVRDVIFRIADLLGRRDLLRLGARSAAHEPPLVVADVDRLTNEVGWRPRFDLDTGLRDTIRSWREILGEAPEPGAGASDRTAFPTA
ncbi:MAG: NAD(P)-dependent oxidoreductase [Gemmatimonadetes bacterium]|nr:NAD(P)-dependent oxidoreductase [Gemmatimonadota bacterium]